jgi:DegV family protein with EDD domain
MIGFSPKEKRTMPEVALVIDSTTKLPDEDLQALQLSSAPASIVWSGVEYRDNIDIKASDFYTRLETSKDMPTTSQASPATFEAIYGKLVEKGHDILTIVISSRLSGFFSSAMQARSAFPKANIEVIDSLTGAMAIGLVLPKVSQAARLGASLQRCREIAEHALQNTGVLITLETLEFLHRGGRIGGAQKFLATALKFKPILELVNGGFEGIDRVRTTSKAMARVVDILVERIGNRQPVHLAAMHTNAYERACQLLDMAKERIEVTRSVISEVSPAVGVHMGPGAVGFAYMASIE